MNLDRIGKPLGIGRNRAVFACRDDAGLCFKVSHRFSDGAHNRLEAEIWATAPPHVRRWLAPVEWIAEDGTVLVMRRGQRLLSREAVPKAMPAEFKGIDNKSSNFVLLAGAIVMCDYGSKRLAERLRGNRA